MKQMHVLGIELKDYSVREAMRMVDGFLQDAKVNTVSFLSMDVLMMTEENEDLREWLTSMDLTVPVSAEILQAAQLASRNRVAEVEDGKFYKDLLAKLSDEKRSAFLLTEKEETIESFSQYLSETAPGIEIVGSYAFENLTGDPDLIVNEINSTFPDVVLSRLSSPKQEQFVYEHKAKLNAKMWVALKEEFASTDRRKTSGPHKLRQWIRSKVFQRRVSQFTTEQDDQGENS